MKRSPLSRVIALFVGLWFVAMTAAPELMHACPMHGAHAGMAMQMGGAGQNGRVAAPLPESQRAADNESLPPHGNQCTCLGHCCSAGPVALIATSVSLADLVTVATRDVGLPDYAYVPVAAQHVLPPALAPPVAA